MKEIRGKPTHTYCWWLWDCAYINETGGVSACCDRGIGIIGNINKQKLKDIWDKSIRLKIFRWLSLHGELPCFLRCDHLSSMEKSSTLRSRIATTYPKFIHITYGTFCNFSCTMCGQDHASRQELDMERIKKNIEWDQVQEVILQGGEVLAMNHAKEFYRWLTEQKNKKVNLITNGFFINDEWARYLIKGARWIIVSVNAATERTFELVNNSRGFNKVIDNIKKLVSLKHACGADVTIGYHLTIVTQNISEIPDVILLADTLGCDIVTYSYVESALAFLREHETIRGHIKARILDVMNSHKVKIKIRGQYLERLRLLDPYLRRDSISYSL